MALLRRSLKVHRRWELLNTRSTARQVGGAWGQPGITWGEPSGLLLLHSSHLSITVTACSPGPAPPGPPGSSPCRRQQGRGHLDRICWDPAQRTQDPVDMAPGAMGELGEGAAERREGQGGGASSFPAGATRKTGGWRGSDWAWGPGRGALAARNNGGTLAVGQSWGGGETGDGGGRRVDGWTHGQGTRLLRRYRVLGALHCPPFGRPAARNLLVSWRARLPYPLTTRTPSPLGAPTSPGRIPSHSPSPPGAPSPRPPKSSSPQGGPPAPNSRPPIPRAPSPRGVPAADSGQSTRRTGLGPAATSSWAGGGASQPQPQGVGGGAQGQSGESRSHPLPWVLGLRAPRLTKIIRNRPSPLYGWDN